MSRLIAPVGEDLARHQPSQRYFLLDERRYGGDDLPRRNLFSAVMQLENSRSVADIKRAVDALIEWLQDPVHQAIKRSFAEWIRQVLVPRRFGASEPGSGTPGPDSPVVGRADRRIAGRAVGSVRAPHPTPAPPASSRDTAIHAPPKPQQPPRGDGHRRAQRLKTDERKVAGVQHDQPFDRSRRQPGRAGHQQACDRARGDAVPQPGVQKGPADERIRRAEEPDDPDLLAPALDSETDGVPPR